MMDENKDKKYSKIFQKLIKFFKMFYNKKFVFIVIPIIVYPYITRKNEIGIYERFSNLFPSSEKIEKILKFVQNLDEFSFQSIQEDSPGKIMADKNIKAHSPIIIIPGITSTSLELWKGLKGTEPHFRKRIWGSFDMLKYIFTDKESWYRHMKLCGKTGLDPKDIKVRAAQGLGAADFILPGYWVWGKIIQNLAEIGYDYNNLHVASFDWRLGMEELEERDHYFTRLKSEIELLRKINKKKVVLMSHSLGSLVCYYFLNWVQSPQGGNGGEKWVHENLDSYINIAAPMLGVTKTFSGLISGEARDTVKSGVIEDAIMDFAFKREDRRDLFRTWGSMKTLLPKGGNKFWGSRKGTADNCQSNAIINFTSEYPSLFVEDMFWLLKLLLPKEIYSKIVNNCDYGHKNIDGKDRRKWTNPLLCPLPNAPDFRIYSFYGVGKLTERAYIYTETNNSKDILKGIFSFIKNEDLKKKRLRIDNEKNDPSKNLCNGIYLVDGDGTVPLVSSGYMGRRGWKRKDLNPNNIKTIVREYVHEPLSMIKDMRGGPKTSDHVDILGNHDMTIDILKIVSKTEELEDNVISELDKICDAVDNN